MYIKSLILKYGLVFLFASLIIYIFNLQKTSHIDDFLKKDMQSLQNNYEETLNDTYTYIDIISNNHFENNSDLIELLKANRSLKTKSLQLNKTVQQKFQQFKQYGIDELNFYSDNGELILNSKYPHIKDSLNQTMIKKVIKNHKDYRDFEFSNTTLSLRYIKLLMDKKFKVVGAVEFVFNLPKIAFFIHQKSDYTIKFLFDKALVEKKLKGKFLEPFKSFSFNPKYVFHTSVYENAQANKIYEALFKKNERKIKSVQQLNREHFFNFEYEKEHYSLFFVPLYFNQGKNTLGHLLAYHKSSELQQIIESYRTKVFFFIFIAFVLTVLLYVIHVLSIRNKINHKKYRDLKDDIDKYILMSETDKEGIITYVTQAFCNVSGYSKEHLIGRPQNIVRHPDMSKKVFSNMWKTLHAGKSWEGEIKNIDINGNSYWIRGIIVPLFDIKNNITGYRSIRVNITDEKQLLKVNSILKDDLALKLNEIKTKDRTSHDESKIILMGKVLDAFANEWKKPISNISLKMLDLKTRVDTEMPSKEYLLDLETTMSKSIKELSTYLNEFKYIFYTKNKDEKYNVYDELNLVISSLKKSTDYTIELTGDENVQSYGMASDLNKVVSSLINNAIEQFKIKNMSNGKISLHVALEGEHINICCQDNAQGIPEEIMDKIFEPDFTTKFDLVSKGLSLYISKLILEKNGGNLSVKNVPNGSCFSLTLLSKNRRKERR